MHAGSRLSSPLLFFILFCLLTASVSAQNPPPGYNSHWRTADGTEKLALEFGGGWDIATGPLRATQTRGWNYVMGSGYNFNRRLALLGEFSFNRFTIPPIISTNPDYTPPTGGLHIWSLTVEPKYQYHATERVGAYIIGGGGFYRTIVQPGGTCSGSCAHTVASTGGLNFGTGIALKVSENSNAKFYAEVRYTWIDNPVDPAGTAFDPLGTHNTYLPITAGIRW